MLGQWSVHRLFPLTNKHCIVRAGLSIQKLLLTGSFVLFANCESVVGYLACPSWNFFCQHFFAGSIFLLFPAPGAALLPVAHHLDHSPFHFLRSPVEAAGEQVAPLGEFEPAGGRLIQAWSRWAQAPQFADAWGRRRVEWKE